MAGFAGAVIAIVGADASAILGTLDGLARGSAGLALFLGVTLLVASFVVALRGTLLRHALSDLSGQEISNYTEERFTHEPDLWRVQIRMINGMLGAIAATTRLGDKAATTLTWAGRLFLAGLLAVGVALAILIGAETF